MVISKDEAKCLIVYKQSELITVALIKKRRIYAPKQIPDLPHDNFLILLKFSRKCRMLNSLALEPSLFYQLESILQA